MSAPPRAQFLLTAVFLVYGHTLLFLYVSCNVFIETAHLKDGSRFPSSLLTLSSFLLPSVVVCW